ncbi:MAG: pyridoxamine 5'-phosphate oxidase [Actinomycetota bacterium]|nr:pyridoxamine 5'-phosphate oxidase [Actinomycetota bacterium]
MDERARPLREEDVDADPLRQFGLWFDEARRSGLRAPEAAALATATPDGRPSARMVLVKTFDERGFVFYSGTESRKGRELRANPRAALLFHWDALGRQVRIEGGVEPLPRAEAEAYFATRPRGSRLSAWASPQSSVIEGRPWLERRVADAAARFEDADVPLPAAWGGFRLAPEVYELWQHREDRLHDRLRYVRNAEGWRLERLAP